MTIHELEKAIPTMPRECYEALLHTANNVKEEPIVKKKLSFAFVLALMILITASVAFAISQWQKNMEQLAGMQAQSGPFHAWQTSDKIELIRMLVEDGQIAETEQTRKLLSGGYPQVEADQIALRIVLDWFGSPYLSVDLMGIAQQLWGPLGSWTMEEAAWFSDIALEAGIVTEWDKVYMLPREGDIPLEEAVRIAKDAIRSVFEVDESVFDTYTYSFYAPPDQLDAPRWLIRFAPHNFRFVFYEGMTVDSLARLVTRHLATEHEMESIDYVPEVAVSAIDGQVVSDPQLGVWHPAEFIETAKKYMKPLYPAMFAFETNAQSTTGNFYGMSLWDKAVWSRDVRPLILQALADDPETYANDYDLISKATYIYGLPSLDDIPQQTAFDIASRAVMETFDVSQDVLSLFECYAYYDITDPETPLWKFYFSAKTSGIHDLEESMKNDTWGQGRLGEVIGQWGRGYKVEMLSVNGEIIHIVEDLTEGVEALDTYLMWL